MPRTLPPRSGARCHLFWPAALVLALALPATAQNRAQDRDPTPRVTTEIERRLQEVDEETRIRQEGPGILSEPLQRAELPPPGGPTFALRRVIFTPASAFLSDAELDAIAARYVGRTVDFWAISELVRDVNDLYAEKGVVTAAAILQPQDLGGGELVVTLVEGQVGVVGVAGAEDLRDGFVFDRVRFARGNTVDVPTASADISRFNRTHRAQLRLLLQPGAEFGTTDLIFGVTEPPRHYVQIYVENSGQKSTGELVFGAIYRRYGLAGIDDTLLLFLEAARGSRALTFRYDAPIGTRGTRAALTHSETRTKVIDGPTEGLAIRGQARSTSLSLSHPFRADETWLVSATLSASQGRTRSTSAGRPLVDTDVTRLAPGIAVGYFAERWRAEGQVQIINARARSRSREGKVEGGDDRTVVETTRHTIVAGSGQASWAVRENFTLVGRGGFQWTRSQLLPGSLLYQIGGPSTVRGYPAEGVAGDSGFFGNIELQRPVTFAGRSHDAFAFLDFGRVYSTFQPSTMLVSAGVGVTYAISDRWRLELSLAAPLQRAVPNQSSVALSAGLVFTRF